MIVLGQRLPHQNNICVLHTKNPAADAWNKKKSVQEDTNNKVRATWKFSNVLFSLQQLYAYLFF